MKRAGAGRGALALSLCAAGISLTLLANCGYNRKNYDTPTDPAKGYLLLTASNNTSCSPPSGTAACLPADGFSQLLITAQISPDSVNRVISFSTSAGTFVGAAAPGNSITATVSSAGSATVALQSASQVGTAVVTAQVMGTPQAAATLSIAFVAPGASSVIQSLSAPASAPADGASSSLISVQLAPNLPAASRSVTLNTTAGSFASGAALSMITVIADVNGRAIVPIYSPTTVSEAVITATAQQNTRQTVISFVPALPQTILVALSKSSVQNTLSDSVTIMATLLRSPGVVTANTVANFVVQDSEGAPIGLFTSILPSNAQGVATAVFTPGNGIHPGKATVIVTVPGSTAQGEASLIIVKPTS